MVENRISLLYLLTERQNVFACMVTNVSIQVTVGSGALSADLTHFPLDHFIILVGRASHLKM